MQKLIKEYLKINFKLKIKSKSYKNGIRLLVPVNGFTIQK